MRESGARPNIILINCDDLGYGDPNCPYTRAQDDTEALSVTYFTMISVPAGGGIIRHWIALISKF